MNAALEQRASYTDYLASPAWRKRRDAALRRAEHRCQLCYSPDRLNVHHRTYKRVGEERPADLTVLCRPCHQRFHHILPAKPKPKRKRGPSRPRKVEPPFTAARLAEWGIPWPPPKGWRKKLERGF